MSQTASPPSPRRFSVAHLLLIVPWVALVIDAWSEIRDNSFIWHIRAGELQAAAGEVITADPFSFTMPNEPWVTQSWLIELGYWWGEDTAGGLGFVPWMLLGTTVLTFVAISIFAWMRSKSLLSAAIVSYLSVFVLISFLVPRPVIFSYALFGLAIIAWERKSLRWTLPFIFWIWASIHGSFPMGLAYVGLSLLAEKEWRWLPTAIVSGLVTLVTAHGWGVVDMLLDFVEVRSTLGLLSEWQTPDLLSPLFIPFLIGLVIILVGMVRGRLAWSHLLVVVPFAYLATTSMRSVPPAWIGIAPAVATALGPIRWGTQRRFGAVPAAVFGMAVFVMPLLLRGDGQLSEERFPVAAATHLENVNTFHNDRTGGYLIYEMGPEFKVFIDDRAEMYGDRMAEFVAVRDGDEPWQPLFERDGIEQVLLPADSDLAAEISGSGWDTVYQDDEYLVLRP